MAVPLLQFEDRRRTEQIIQGITLVHLIGRNRTVRSSTVLLFHSGGPLVLLFYPNPSNDWAFWIGAGIINYGAVIAIHGSLAFVRLFRKAATESLAV